MTTHSAVLQFMSDTNELIRITIPRARQNITEPEARNAMTAMITGQSIVTGFGRPHAIRSMDIVTTNRINLV